MGFFRKEVYNDLLACFERVEIEMRKEIVDYFEQFTDDYLLSILNTPFQFSGGFFSKLSIRSFNAKAIKSELYFPK